jgi:hypothetical protein
MEFPFKITDIFKVAPDGFVSLTSKDLPNSGQSYSAKNPLKTPSEKIQHVLDTIGAASAKAQSLPTVITSFSRFVYSNHRLYIKFDGDRMIGFIKVGVKNLIYCDRMGKMKELSPLCVLDFYVDESVQRHGYGRIVYDRMRAAENVEPHKLAIDRPSPKFLGFMGKHFGLTSFRSQSNSFVIFDDFFETDSKRLVELRAKWVPPKPAKEILARDKTPPKSGKTDPEKLQETPTPSQKKCLKKSIFESDSWWIPNYSHQALLRGLEGGLKRVRENRPRTPRARSGAKSRDRPDHPIFLIF